VLGKFQNVYFRKRSYEQIYGCLTTRPGTGLFSTDRHAQPKIIVRIDTAYAHSGKVEFPLSQFGDEITDFYGIFPDVKDVSNVTVCGKVGTANPIQKSLVSSN